MKTLKIDRARMVERMNAAFICVNYEMGAKPRLGSLPGAGFTKSDCSGFVRWLIYAASTDNPKVRMPAGSVLQRQWCEDQGFKRTDYANCQLHDSRLRIAFFPPKSEKEAGHVWLVINGQTIESYGGNGPGRRPWNTKVLKDKVTHCFVLTDELV